MNKFFSDEIDNFVRQHSRSLSRLEMINLIFNEFGLTVNISQLKNAYVRLKIGSRRDKTGRRANIGDTRVNNKGFRQIKTEKGWMLEHLMLWKQEFGEISNHNVIVFLDGNRNNVSKSNLTILNPREHYFYRKLISEVGIIDSKTLINLSRLKAKIYEKKCDL